MPQFKTTLKKSDFQEGKLMKSEIGDKSIVIGMVEDKLYAMDSVCSHEGGPLEQGISGGSCARPCMSTMCDHSTLVKSVVKVLSLPTTFHE